jgi:cobalt/nickel transport system permease protein
LARPLNGSYPNRVSLTPEHLAPPDSPLARRDPRWRLAALAVAIFGVAFLRQFGPAAAALGLALTLALVGRVPGRWYRTRVGVLLVALVPFLAVVPFTVDRGDRLWEWHFLHVTDAGLVVAATLAMKMLALVTLALTLLATAPLNVTLAAAGRLGVPRLLVHLTLLTYRYVFLLLDELNRLRIALRVRGFRNAMTAHAYRTVGQVTGTLLVRGADRADRVAQAMRCRGFDGHFRTAATFRTTPADVLLLLLIVGTVSGLVAWDAWG